MTDEDTKLAVVALFDKAHKQQNPGNPMPFYRLARDLDSGRMVIVDAETAKKWSKQEDKYDALKKHADALSSALMWKICGSDSDNMRSVVKEYYAREGGTPVIKALVEYWQEFDGESCDCGSNHSCSRCFEPCKECDSWGHTTREHDEWEETAR